MKNNKKNEWWRNIRPGKDVPLPNPKEIFPFLSRYQVVLIENSSHMYRASRNRKECFFVGIPAILTEMLDQNRPLGDDQVWMALNAKLEKEMDKVIDKIRYG